MVVLYVGGQKVGTQADLDKLLPDLAARRVEAEFRDEAGNTIGRFVPGAEPICPWEPDLTREDLDRISAEGGGIPLAEFWKRMNVE